MERVRQLDIKKINKTMSHSERYKLPTSSLPADFVKHLRCVFETLDRGNNGFIKVSDLEKYWQNHYNLDSSTANSLIIKRLNEIAPYDMGLISFPRLCTGVKEALMQSKTHKNRKISFIYALSLNDDDTRDSGISDITEEDSDEVHHNPSLSPKLRRPDPLKVKAREKNVQELLGYGIRMTDQIKSWYIRHNSQYYNGEIKELRHEDVEKIVQLNDTLQNIISVQQDKKTFIKDKPDSDHKKVIKSLKSKVSKLENEKSVLIRELFQLKAHLKSSTSPSIVDV